MKALIRVLPAGLATCGSCMRSVSDDCLKEPVRVNEEVLGSKFIVTDSLSRFCFLSKQTAKAQPTA